MATATPNIIEVYEERLEQNGAILPIDLRHLQEALTSIEARHTQALTLQTHLKRDQNLYGTGDHVEDGIDLVVDELRCELDRGQKIADQMSDVLSGRGMSFRAASFPIATHTAAAE